MEKALYNGKLIYASQIALDYETEKLIRQASAKGLLLCPDNVCKNRRLRYCHGEKKDAYFAHVENDFCDYADFDRKNTYTKDIRIALYTHFKNKGYDVDIESKLLPNHRAQLVFNYYDKPVAVEIGTKFITTSRVDEISFGYSDKEIACIWLVAGEFSGDVLSEVDLGFIKRYVINESKDKYCVVIDYHTLQVTQFKFRDNRLYKEHCYIQTGNIENLIFENESISLFGFRENYEKWLQDVILQENSRKAQKHETHTDVKMGTEVTPPVSRKPTFEQSYNQNKEKSFSYKPLYNPYDKNSKRNLHSYWVIEYRKRHYRQKCYNDTAVCDRVFAFVDQNKNVCVYPCPISPKNICRNVEKCERCEYMFKETGCSARITEKQLEMKSLATSAIKDSEGRLLSAVFNGNISCDFPEIMPIGRSIPSLLKSFDVQTRAWFINIRDFLMTPEINPKDIDSQLVIHPEFDENIWIIYDWDF